MFYYPWSVSPNALPLWTHVRLKPVAWTSQFKVALQCTFLGRRLENSTFHFPGTQHKPSSTTVMSFLVNIKWQCKANWLSAETD